MNISLGDKISEGKTKCIHKVPGSEKTVYIVSKDSITAGDGAKKDVLPGKAIFSTTTTANVFRLFNASGIDTHYIKQVDDKAFEAVACAMVPLEVIVRRRVTGSYLKRNPHLTEGATLNPCVVEFTFKDDQNHDPLVTEPEILAMKLKCGGTDITSKILASMHSVAVSAFEVLESAWALHDVVLVDFKVEFGVADGKLVLADVIDNDSWRIWPHGDRTQMKDKQVYRNIPKVGTAPTVEGTLNQEQQSTLVKNYEWVAEMSSRLLDVLGKKTSTPATTSSPAPLVGIIMGSQSDWETMQLGAQVLEKLGIPHEVRIVSAHRTPDRLFEYAKSARERGLHVIIAGAGGAAHLPGMVAALTPLPVLGVPVQSRTLSGVDSLLSIVQMPAGIPVGTLAIGNAGATNAALLAASILATKFPNFAAPLDAWRRKQTDDVAEVPTSGVAGAHGHAAPAPTPAVASILSAATRASPAPSAPVTAPATKSHTKKEARVLPPGSTIGILGGGQLGRMTAIAAAQLGYRVHVFCPEKDPPAAQVANELITANYNDHAALDTFASQVDVVTYEFENIDAAAVEYLAAQVPVRPDPKALRICQDRVAEKRFVNSLNIKTAPFAPVGNPVELREAVQKIGLPAILKSNTLGYDGKGQVKITQDTDLDAAWSAVTRTGSASAVLEGFVEFEREVSVIVARGADGRDAAFPVVENEHRDHILYRTTVPARAGLSDTTQSYAVDIARRIAAGLDLVGVIAVEMFVVPRENEVDILVNELAPRPHNSGHWTIEGSATSQFEQLVRAACGLPLGSIGKVARCEMTNLIGKEVEGWAEYVAQEGVHLHVYGKHEAREGRKMGHVTKIL